jgi:DNA polymerase elongation subunit (family B)
MNLVNLLRCGHRHDINHHPGCFHAGNINQEQALKVYEENGKPWYHLDGLKIGYLDIESGGLKPDFDPMLSWCIKTKEGDVAYDVITRQELFDNGVDGDKRIVESLAKEMLKYKIIVTYYGSGFDIPLIRTKAMRHNIYFPAYINEEYKKRDGSITVRSVPELFHFDLYYLVKSKMLLSRYSLDNVCDFLGIEGKTH